MATELELGPGQWKSYRAAQRQRLAQRIAEGSAEHVTYYVLQSRRFTRRAPIDPVRLAAGKPTSMPATVAERFADFASATMIPDERFALVRDLAQRLQWTPEALFGHTMAFLAERRQGDREALYQRRGLSSDTVPAQTLVLDWALRHLGPRARGRTLLAGPGLDLTRREGFVDETPLRSYQVERLLSAGQPLDCVDVRPEVLAHLKTRPVCAREMDVTTHFANGPYTFAVATNLLLYLDDRGLFAALAGLARSLAPGGYLLHNDQRFAAKAFGEMLGLPVERFEPIRLGTRQGVELMDRAVIHRKV